MGVAAAGMVIGTMTTGAVGSGVMTGMMASVIEIGLMMMAMVVEKAPLVVARGLAEVAVLLRNPVTMLLLVAVAVAGHLLEVVRAVGLPLLPHIGETAVPPQLLLMAMLLAAVLSAAILLTFVLAGMMMMMMMMMMGGVAVLQASKALLLLLLNKLKMLLGSVLKLQEKQLLSLLPALRRQLP